MADGCPYGTLYVVGTPIGNLDDITLRAVEVLKRVQTIAAEDTRHSRILLDRIGAQPARLVSMHDHNESRRVAELLTDLQQGHDVALVSDAGTPLVSDPGFLLVRACWQSGVTVTPIPGASAVTAALSISPLPAERFLFIGFLPARAKARIDTLRSVRDAEACVVFFEAPHRMNESLRDVADHIGKERRLMVAKELTKVHERVELGTAEEILARLEATASLDRGEYVCLIEAKDAPATSNDARRVMDVLLAELAPAQAARLAAKLTGVARAELYTYALTLSRGDASPAASRDDDSRDDEDGIG